MRNRLKEFMFGVVASLGNYSCFLYSRYYNRLPLKEKLNAIDSVTFFMYFSFGFFVSQLVLAIVMDPYFIYGIAVFVVLAVLFMIKEC